MALQLVLVSMFPDGISELDRRVLQWVLQQVIETERLPTSFGTAIQVRVGEAGVTSLVRRGLLQRLGDWCYLTRNGVRASGDERALADLDKLNPLLSILRQECIAEVTHEWSRDELAHRLSVGPSDVGRILLLAPQYVVSLGHDPASRIPVSCTVRREIVGIEIAKVCAPEWEDEPIVSVLGLAAWYHAGRRDFSRVELRERLQCLPEQMGLAYRGFRFSGIHVKSGILQGIGLFGCDFSASRFGDVAFVGDVFQQSALDEVDFGAARFDGTMFVGCTLRRIQLGDAVFGGLDVSGSAFSSTTPALHERVLGCTSWSHVYVDDVLVQRGQSSQPGPSEPASETGPSAESPETAARLVFIEREGSQMLDVLLDGSARAEVKSKLVGVRPIRGILARQKQDVHVLDLKSYAEGADELPSTLLEDDRRQELEARFEVTVTMPDHDLDGRRRVSACLRRLEWLAHRMSAGSSRTGGKWTPETEFHAIVSILRSGEYKLRFGEAADPIVAAVDNVRRGFERVRDQLPRAFAEHLDGSITRGEWWRCVEPLADRVETTPTSG